MNLQTKVLLSVLFVLVWCLGNQASAALNPASGAAQPIITCPANVLTPCVNPMGAVITYPAPTVTDPTDPNPVVTCTPSSGSTFPLGLTTVTCTARNAGGLTSTCTFTVLVQDTTPPVVTLAAAFPGECIPGVFPSTTTSITVTGTVLDDCGVTSVQTTATQPGRMPITSMCTVTGTTFSCPLTGLSPTSGPVTITAIATDAVGNTGMGTPRTVRINRPSVTLATAFPGECIPGVFPSTTTSIMVTGTVLDECGGTVVRTTATQPGRTPITSMCTVTGNTFSCILPGLPPASGPVTITVMATDAVGTISMATRNVRINRLPVANAGPDRPENESCTVTLNGTGATDPDGDPLTYRFRVLNVSDPRFPITLLNPTNIMPTFVAPRLAVTDPSCIMATFELVVTDTCGEQSLPDTITITLENHLILQDNRNRNTLTINLCTNRYEFFNVRTGQRLAGPTRIVRGQGDSHQWHISDFTTPPGLLNRVSANVDVQRLVGTAVIIVGQNTLGLSDGNIENNLVECPTRAF